MTENSLTIILPIAFGLCWTLAYLLIIYRGFKDQCYAMPIIACAGNITWEFYVVLHNPFGSDLTTYANYFWLVLDFIILYQVLLFAPKEFPRFPKTILRALILLALVFGYCIMEFGYADQQTLIKNAFADNFMMSALFIGMLVKRGTAAGQSIYIAFFKGLGTALVFVLIYFVNESFHDEKLVTFAYIATLILDVIYFVLLYWIIKSQGENPWKRI